jgi:hypothetical protein
MLLPTVWNRASLPFQDSVEDHSQEIKSELKTSIQSAMTDLEKGLIEHEEVEQEQQQQQERAKTSIDKTWTQ